VVLVSAYQIGSSTAGKERRGTSGTMEDQRDTTDVEESLREVSIEDRGTRNSHKGEVEDKDDGGVLGFFKDVGKAIGGAFSWGKPDADISGFHLPVINTQRAEVIIDVLITNPNPIPIPLLDMIYDISSDGRKLCSGTIPDAGTVHAHGSETIKIPLTLIYKDIVDTFDDIEPGQIIPYLVKVCDSQILEVVLFLWIEII
jgi:hypothetical protein